MQRGRDIVGDAVLQGQRILTGAVIADASQYEPILAPHQPDRYPMLASCLAISPRCRSLPLKPNEVVGLGKWVPIVSDETRIFISAEFKKR